jgi:hypothetical protein
MNSFRDYYRNKGLQKQPVAAASPSLPNLNFVRPGWPMQPAGIGDVFDIGKGRPLGGMINGMKYDSGNSGIYQPQSQPLQSMEKSNDQSPGQINPFQALLGMMGSPYSGAMPGMSGGMFRMPGPGVTRVPQGIDPTKWLQMDAQERMRWLEMSQAAGPSPGDGYELVQAPGDGWNGFRNPKLVWQKKMPKGVLK